ncbi:MAG: hypothetical protein KAJ01_02670, partial [Candidatus Hydrogenedentes bacterium]|nr:hypothetical protein [Candidatus Hydrogenedentota bacterium]
AGVAAVNRPYIKFMRPLEVVVRDGKEMVRAQIVRFGVYKHPSGPDGKLPFTRKFWGKVRNNFSEKSFGQKIFFDPAHQPNKESYGEIVDLEETSDGMDAIIDPTEDGLDAIKKKKFNYASIDLLWNHKNNQVAITASELPELEEVDLALDAVNMLLEEEVSSMKSKNEQETPPEDNATDTTVVTEAPASNGQVAVELAEVKALKDELKAESVKLTEEREAFAPERAQMREQLRRDQVRVYLSELGQPDTNGGMLDKDVLDVVGSILLGDPVSVEDERSIQLSDEDGVVDVHAYYREAVETLARAIPRVVPSASNIDVKSQDKRLEDVSLNSKRQEHLEAKILAAQEVGKPTDEAFMKEANEQLDRIYGVTGQEG